VHTKGGIVTKTTTVWREEGSDTSHTGEGRQERKGVIKMEKDKKKIRREKGGRNGEFGSGTADGSQKKTEGKEGRRE